jgi:hypothetical protein
MPKFKVNHFGALDTNNLEEYYEVTIPFEDKSISIDLNFDEDTVSESKLKVVNLFLEQLQQQDSVAKLAIQKDYKDGNVVAEYIEHHLDVLNSEELNAVFASIDATLSNEDKVLAVLHLKRVGFYPDEENQFAVFDYTIDKELTDYLVVVNFRKDGKIDHITMES